MQCERTLELLTLTDNLVPKTGPPPSLSHVCLSMGMFWPLKVNLVDMVVNFEDDSNMTQSMCVYVY